MNAVFAADAVARLSGKVGVAAVTAGPGILGFFIYQIFWTVLESYTVLKRAIECTKPC